MAEKDHRKLAEKLRDFGIEVHDKLREMGQSLESVLDSAGEKVDDKIDDFAHSHLEKTPVVGKLLASLVDKIGDALESALKLTGDVSARGADDLGEAVEDFFSYEESSVKSQEQQALKADICIQQDQCMPHTHAEVQLIF